MCDNFSERYNIVFGKYAKLITEMGGKPSESGLARFLGVSQTTTQRWKNYQIPNGKGLKAIHDKLGFSYDWLIAGEGEMFDTRDAEIARLRTRQLVEGTTDKTAVTDTARAAGQE